MPLPTTGVSISICSESAKRRFQVRGRECKQMVVLLTALVVCLVSTGSNCQSTCWVRRRYSGRSCSPRRGCSGARPAPDRLKSAHPRQSAAESYPTPPNLPYHPPRKYRCAGFAGRCALRAGSGSGRCRIARTTEVRVGDEPP